MHYYGTYTFNHQAGVEYNKEQFDNDYYSSGSDDNSSYNDSDERASEDTNNIDNESQNEGNQQDQISVSPVMSTFENEEEEIVFEEESQESYAPLDTELHDEETTNQQSSPHHC
eukprot:15365508-Ditylum_brightwellii.AAC.1